jgi:hypothetical protein
MEHIFLMVFVRCPGEVTLIQEGADNADINTETIDGKDTFHSMARAVFQVKSAPPSSEDLNDARIKRNQERSLPLNKGNNKITELRTI